MGCDFGSPALRCTFVCSPPRGLAGGALGLRGVSRHNTCATEALGVLDRTGQAPGQRPCAQPGRAGVCSVCRTSPWLAGRCLDNQAEDHRDASFLCLLWFTAVPTRASTAWSFELRLWPSSVLTRGRMRGLRTRGWSLGEADFCYDRAGPWAVSGSVQRQLRCLQPAWPAGWEGAGAELARDAGSVVCIRSHPHSCPSTDS